MRLTLYTNGRHRYIARAWLEDTTGYGAVSYTYNIGTYDVTAGQYTAFLNAVAQTDTYGLYNTSMETDTTYGCQIQQSGSSGSYVYSVSNTYANRPVNYVSYWDSCRFANWLNNGQPTGAQGPGTTETGSYTLNGYNGNFGQSIQRNPGSIWAVTSEDEWYKAAYYKGGSTNAGYWSYATGSDSITTGKANYNMAVGHTTDVGSYAYPSPYGTYDQNGNVWDWNEAIPYQDSNYAYRGLRGGSFGNYGSSLQAADWYDSIPSDESYDVGFRVSEAVPEPLTIVAVLMGLGGLGRYVRRRAQ